MNSDTLAQAYAYLTTNFPALRLITIVRRDYIVFHRENPEARESITSVVTRRLFPGWGSLFRCPPESFVHNYQARWAQDKWQWRGKHRKQLRRHVGGNMNRKYEVKPEWTQQALVVYGGLIAIG